MVTVNRYIRYYRDSDHEVRLFEFSDGAFMIWWPYMPVGVQPLPVAVVKDGLAFTSPRVLLARYLNVVHDMFQSLHFRPHSPAEDASRTLDTGRTQPIDVEVMRLAREEIEEEKIIKD